MRTDMSSSRDVLIVGAGLAGLTAAYKLSKMGYRVLLLEERPHAGGRVYSYRDDVTGDPVDNGQHVFLGCCERLLQLLSDAGIPAEDHLQDRLRIRLRSNDGTIHDLAESNLLPFPASLLPLVTGAKFLSLMDRFRIMTTGRTLMQMTKADRQNLDDQTMRRWLKDQQNSDTSINQFWNLFLRSTLNAPAREVSAGAGIHVFQEGLFSEAGAGRIGAADRGQTPFYIDPLVEEIESRNGQIHLRTSVESIRVKNGTFRGVVTSENDVLNGASAVMAVPPDPLRSIIAEMNQLGPLRKDLEQFRTAPIVCANVWVSETVLEEPFSALLDAEADWVFNRTVLEEREQKIPQHLSIVRSAAGDWMEKDNDSLKEVVVKELEQYVSPLSGQMVEHIRITREPHATFVPEPGLNAHRPGPETQIDGLFLAGAWTDTGWPSTMESAVRSGEQAAEQVDCFL